MNPEIIQEIEDQYYEKITKLFEDFLHEQIEKNKAEGLILGLSGGIDSAVLAYLCKRSLKEFSYFFIILIFDFLYDLRIHLIFEINSMNKSCVAIF